MSTALLAVALVGCGSSAPESPDVQSAVEQSLDQNGFKNVSVSQDREKGVVTLKGNVNSQADKERAGSIAKSLAGGQVVANEIAVTPPGAENANSVNSDLDQAIQKNLNAAFTQNGLKDQVNTSVKNGVVTLTGNVDSQAKRAQAQQVASSVPNVQQVVNELQVKGQKATAE
ncbi:MAG TPA: BON domain-containing protein [Bryobacteraceae bacterium]|nr:BON domain-containing protein [Bryobacteraceae bacterium]